MLLTGMALLAGSGIALQWPNEFKSQPPAAAAAVIAVAGLLITFAQTLRDRAEARSRFYLDEYRRGYDTAYEVLKSAVTADERLRMKWIAAARMLEEARRISAKVSVSAHRNVLNIELPKQSQRFEEFLSKSAEYYYGSGEGLEALYGNQALNEAARRATAKDKHGRLNWHREIDEKVLFTIWNAVQYPKAYSDVIEGRFPEGSALFLNPGLRTYIEHRRRFSSTNGKLYEGAQEVQ